MTGAPWAVVANGRALSLDRVPWLSWDDLSSDLCRGVDAEQRLVALFGDRAPREHQTVLYAILADDQENHLLASRALVEGDRFAAVTPRCPQAHLFEREIAEQFGLVPEGHPWLKPVRWHRSWTGRDAWGRPLDVPIDPAVGEFYRVEGDEVHEVAVGPVHAGVIEPGHFRFQCHGEQVFHLEIALGYQHRGVERAIVEQAPRRGLHYAETLAGDSTIAHATAYCAVLEALGGSFAPARAQSLRAIALELERLANHVGDLGALAGDVGFLPTAAYCGRIRGDFLNLTALLCGNRFGRGMVRPGGVGFDVDAARRDELRRRLDDAAKDTAVAVNLLWRTPSVMARFEDTGRLPPDVARALGVVGVAARASGLGRDVRRDQPGDLFRFAQVPMVTVETGDVLGRAYVRWLEVERSRDFIAAQLSALPAGSVLAPAAARRADHLAVALVEGWRGEVCHAALTGASGHLARYKIVDPSFHNWPGLAYALRNQEISDFPLCNKSFNLSYCGHDL